MTQSDLIGQELDTRERRDREYLPRQTKSALGPYEPVKHEPENAERADLVGDDACLGDLVGLLIRWDRNGLKHVKEYLNAERAKVKARIEVIDAAE